MDIEKNEIRDSKNNEEFKEPKLQNRGFKRYNFNSQILSAIAKIGYKQPTPIQRKTIPELLNGFNIIVKAHTGSGKSAAFILPTLQKLMKHSEIVGTRVVVLSPTRELAKQTLNFFIQLSKGMNLKFAVLTGGDKIENQFERLSLNPDVIIGTPGRITQHLDEGSICLKRVEMLVIDEADKLFEQGFEDQIKIVLKSCSQKKQVALFSATIPDNLSQFMKTGIQEYKYISINIENSVPDSIKLHAIFCRSEERDITLASLLKILPKNEKTIVFTPTKYHCEYLSEYLNCFGIETSSIHGKMDQMLRDTNLSKFKSNNVNILIVTDLAARGLDIPKLENVVNYDFPDNPKLFIHRIGRTGRAGNKGNVISLVNAHDLAYLVETQTFVGKLVKLYDSKVDPNNETNEENKIISIGKPNDGLNKQLIEMNIDKIQRIDEELINAMKNAMKKKNAFKLKPSLISIKNSKDLEREVNRSYVICPFLIDNIKNNSLNLQEDKQNLKDMLRDYRPKKNIIEFLDEDKVFKYDFAKKKKILHTNKHEGNQNTNVDDEKDIIIESNQSKNELNKSKSKKQNINVEEEIKVNNDNMLNKKRNLLKDYKDSKNYISNTKIKGQSLWGEEEPVDLTEVTLNLVSDDVSKMKSTKYAWNEEKKKFVTGVTDSKGNLKKNESNKVIKHSDKKPDYFKRWKSKNRDKLQNFGEMENKKPFEYRNNKFNRNNNDEKNNYSNKSKNVKNELKSYDQLVKNKKDSSRKKYKFAGQIRKLQENKIKDRTHLNTKSMVLVKKKGVFSSNSNNKKGFKKRGRR